MGNELAVDELEEGMIITRLDGVLGIVQERPLQSYAQCGIKGR